MRTLVLSGLMLSNSLVIASPPEVTSAELVAHFIAEPEWLGLDGDAVLTWTATNDPSIMLQTLGTDDPSSIRFDAAALGGLGSIIVRDTGNRYMRGNLNLGDSLSDATIFWLGMYEPGADGSPGDGSGQYVYSLGHAAGQGAQMDHQIDDGRFELYGGSGTQGGRFISYLNGYNSVWRTDHFSGAPGHHATANGVNLQIPNDGGYGVDPAHELQLFGWQDGSGNAGGYNFVGEFAEMLIFKGRIDDNDAAAVHAYLDARLDRTPPEPPEPGDPEAFIVQISGVNSAGDSAPDALYPHGDSDVSGWGTFFFDPVTSEMDFVIDLDGPFVVTQAHFYNLGIKPNGDSIFCWGGRWSHHEFLDGEGFHVSASHVSSILSNPSDWVLVLHTEGGHFALDANGDLIEYDALLHETSETGQVEDGDRYNNRVPRLLTNRLLREQNPNSGGFGDPAFDAVYPDPNHFGRKHGSPFPDADGNAWIEWNEVQGRYVPTAYGASRGLTNEDIDTKAYLFYRYDDQGPSWDYGGPEGAMGGVLEVAACNPADLSMPFRTLDIFDILSFLGAFADGDDLADWNGDTILDIFDVLEYLEDFDAGC